MLCIIEAMKLMNEINAECDGEIVKVYVENGQAVQYGERLFRRSNRAMMFKKILIANRGEIALRIIHACRELGIKTVAVYSEADENSLHVRFADEDVCIGPPRSADSYLNVPAIISAAEITGADAIHPGYGFLSESAYLAEVCEACHIRFIGPDPSVIKLLGDKARARKAMKKAGVPMLPGSDGPVDGRGAGAEGRQGHRLPGDHQGGRRRRRARHARRPQRRRAAATRSRPRSARPRRPSATATSTSRSTSRIPRHIEFQIIGDHHGNVVHLGERECSIQRRHQKLIEESPSPALTDKVAHEDGQPGRRCGQGGAVHQRRHVRVPDGRRRAVLLHGDEHAPPGRASGHRDGHRHRHRQGADPDRGGRAALVQAERRRRSPATRSSAASTPRIPRRSRRRRA